MRKSIQQLKISEEMKKKQINENLVYLKSYYGNKESQ